MRFSKLFSFSTKENSKNAELISHNLLLKSGFIKQSGSGLYDLMPLGKMVLENIKKVIKEEMDNSDCNEVQLSFVTPLSLWKESGREDSMGKELLRIKDRKSVDYVLSATNEEGMVNLIRNNVKSYKQLPLNIYQINTKFRDELRPRFGLLRTREFIMKDAYSFHSSKEDLETEFNKMRETYKRIFNRLNIEYKIVKADSGAIGGDKSEEFMVLADSGEDTLIVCDNCEYGANIEVSNEKEGDTCSCCNNGKLKRTKGIEVGHIFQLGTKYSEAMNSTYLDNNGKMKYFEMGCYGIGVSRLISAIIEQNHDEKGMLWSKETTPFSLDIIMTDIKKEEIVQYGEELYKEFKKENIKVILDDRNQKFGYKITEFELFGFEYAIVIGKKLKEGKVEFINRKNNKKEEIEIKDIKNKILNL